MNKIDKARSRIAARRQTSRVHTSHNNNSNMEAMNIKGLLMLLMLTFGHCIDTFGGLNLLGNTNIGARKGNVRGANLKSGTSTATFTGVNTIEGDGKSQDLASVQRIPKVAESKKQPNVSTPSQKYHSKSATSNHEVLALVNTGMNSKIDSNIDVQDTRATESAGTLHEVEDPATTREVSNMDDGTVDFKGIKAEAATARGLKGLASIHYEDLNTGSYSKAAATDSTEQTTTLHHELESSVNSREVSTVKNNGILGHEVEVYVEEPDLEASTNVRFPQSELEVAAAAPLPIARILNSGASCGEEAVVHCDNGFEVYVNGTLTGLSCLDACGGENNTNCCAGNGVRKTYNFFSTVNDCESFIESVCPDGNCIGVNGNLGYCAKYIENACENFTGSVCRDGSCIGFEACYLAGSDGGSVGLISGGSCNGTEACRSLGASNGTVGSVSGQSCVGEEACYYLGAVGGNVGSVSQSCIGEEACEDLGYNGGNVGSITNGSCIGDGACRDLGNDEGTVGRVSGHSCIGEEACGSLGYEGTVESVSGQSCIGVEACAELGLEGGNVESVSGQSCIGEEACADLGVSGNVGSVSGQSCVGEYACEDLGQYGTVGSVSGQSCIGEAAACNSLGADGGNVGSVSDHSCIGDDACGSLGRGGTVESVSGQSCIGVEACYQLGYYGNDYGSQVGSICQSCIGNYSCNYLAGRSGGYESSYIYTEPGSVGDIRGSCTAEYACAQVASNSSNNNITAITGCCTDPYECQGNQTDSDLPYECFPSEAPSISIVPSYMPSFMPSLSLEPSTSLEPSPLPTLSPTSPPMALPTVAPSTNPTSSPTALPTTEAPSDPPTVGPSASPTATLKGSVKSRAVLAAKGKGRRQLTEFSDASANCTKAAEDTTTELVEACLEPPNERVSSVSTVNVTRLDKVLTFLQNATIESEVAVSFDDLIACINKRVTDGNATETLRSNAKENGCGELEEGFVDCLAFTEESDLTSICTPSSPGKSSDVSSSPTSTPSSQGKSPDVASTSGKSGKSSSAVPGVSKASSKSSKSVKSAKAEPQVSAEVIDEVEEPKESIELLDEEGPGESIKFDEKEDPEEVTKDEDEVEANKEGWFDVLAKMLGGWW